MIRTPPKITGLLFRPLLDFFYPPVCLHCRQFLNGNEKHVCSTCFGSIERLHPDHPLYRQTRSRLLETGVVADLVSCFVFHADGAFQHMAHAMKYDGFVSIGYLFGHEIGQAMKQRGVEADLLIPIPLHKRKMRERGYNQAELIARGIAEETGIPVRTDVVYRTRYTETQTKLHIDDRKKNVEDAFAVTQHAAAVLGGARCVLVDDVITTGATIVSCAGTLLEAGAQSVLAASIALAE